MTASATAAEPLKVAPAVKSSTTTSTSVDEVRWRRGIGGGVVVRPGGGIGVNIGPRYYPRRYYTPRYYSYPRSYGSYRYGYSYPYYGNYGNYGYYNTPSYGFYYGW